MVYVKQKKFFSGFILKKKGFHMQSNMSVNNLSPNFQAKASKRFIDSAHKAFDREIKNPAMRSNFDEKAAEFENFGYDDYFIKYVKDVKDGKVQHKLVALTGNMKDSEGIVLTSKDRFRKAIEKFTHITKFEFTQKMKQGLEKQAL